MTKDTSISIRIDSNLKMQTEDILKQFGLNMTVVVNMLFHQIVRDHAIPLSLSLNQKMAPIDELNYAATSRLEGYKGRTINNVINDMEQIVAEAETTYGKKEI